jgi:uncharacterized protein YgiM (DUF1202 family)
VLEIKPLTLFKKVFLAELGAAKDTLRCTVVTDLSASGLSYNITQQDKNVLSVYVLNQTEQRTAYWTATTGSEWEHEFTSVPYKEPDLKELGKRAEHDAAAVIPTESVFRIKDKEGNNAVGSDKAVVVSPDQKDMPAVTHNGQTGIEANNSDVSKPADKNVDTPVVSEKASEDRMVFTVSNCNIRTLPSTEGRVIGRGDAGSEVLRIATSKEWTNINMNGMTGWVSSRFLKEIPAVQPEIARNTVPVSSDTRTPIPSDPVTAVQKQRYPAANDSLAIQKVSQQMLLDLESESNELVKRFVRYSARGRDPFKALANDTLVVSGKPIVEQCALVGLLVDDKERIALFEDKTHQRRPFILKENDIVENGKVLKIYRDKVVFLLTEFGISRSYTVKLTDAELEQEVRVR